MAFKDMSCILTKLTKLCVHKVPSLLTKGTIASHDVKKPIQNSAIFKTVKIDNFHMKKCDIFLIFAQNINCGYTLEPPS